MRDVFIFLTISVCVCGAVFAALAFNWSATSFALLAAVQTARAYALEERIDDFRRGRA